MLNPHDHVEEIRARAFEQQKWTKAALGISEEIQRIQDHVRQIQESSRRWDEDTVLTSEALRQRGWYLTGQEACTVVHKLASLARRKDWSAIDNLLLAQAARLRVDVQALEAWLQAREVPACCVRRVRTFLAERDAGQHDAATALGLPLIDELCRALFGGSDFTTKRGRQPRPQVGCSRGQALQQVRGFHERFLEFGVLHEPVDPGRFDDEDYFNRHAILHGMMRRSYGEKDSSKVFMLIMFLVSARDE